MKKLIALLLLVGVLFVSIGCNNPATGVTKSSGGAGGGSTSATGK